MEWETGYFKILPSKNVNRQLCISRLKQISFSSMILQCCELAWTSINQIYHQCHHKNFDMVEATIFNSKPWFGMSLKVSTVWDFCPFQYVILCLFEVNFANTFTRWTQTEAYRYILLYYVLASNSEHCFKQRPLRNITAVM